jgi:DNA polymerase-3 subunit gamma/tau
MAYLALYRKYRPLTFDDVKGQEVVVSALKNEVKTGRVGHAYMLCGSRGIGKTTLAKILARAVNCEHPVDGNPCNECAACKQINAGSSMNVVEIDAASNNRVDDVRELIDGVRYSPTNAKYKVYIIDEVHMLSPGAFNALLKTLEEPPSYVIFILATTDVQKVPVTILSRCQRYDLKRIPVPVIVERLKEIGEKENIKAEEKALSYIARAADGGMRDAVSIFDKCSSFISEGDVLTYDKTLEILGNVDVSVFSGMFESLRARKINECIKVLDEISDSGASIVQFITDFTWYLRNMLLVQLSEDPADAPVDMTSENIALLKQQADEIGNKTLMRYIEVLSGLKNELRNSTDKRVIIELALIKLIEPTSESTDAAVLQRLEQLESELNQQERVLNGMNVDAILSKVNQAVSSGAIVQGSATDAAQRKEALENKKKELLDAMPEDIKEIASRWNEVCSLIEDGMSYATFSNREKVGVSYSDNEIRLLFYSHMDYTQFYSPDFEFQKTIEEAIEKLIGKHVKVTGVDHSGDGKAKEIDIRSILPENVLSLPIVEVNK